MKKIEKLISVLLLCLCFFSAKVSYSQDFPTMCLTDMSQFPQDTIPNYEKDWWDDPNRTGLVAVVYVDFPDGRWYNSGTGQYEQPFTDAQLNDPSLMNKEAAGEVGVIDVGGARSIKAAKYDLYDRWDMYFENTGSYTGSAHPDSDLGEVAYGSFREYWSEVSNNKFDFTPYVTHPNETDPKLKTGIVNDYIDVNGRKIIKMVTVGKKKFGSLGSDSYFTDFYDADSLGEKGWDLLQDAYTAIDNQTSFNRGQFRSEGGILIIVFAGGMRSFKGIGSRFSNGTIIRGRRSHPLTDLQNSKIDGFGIAAHEYAHLEFIWGHSNAGRYCIMNAFDVHHPDSPQHPNPVRKMQQNWITPVYYENSTSVTDLPPIETSHKCGVVTIYGKPDALPDGLGGEVYIVENRRLLGFDRKIAENNNPNGNFKGGLLVWRYIPEAWGRFSEPPCGSAFDKEHEIVTANGDNGLCGSTGDPEHFFAYAQGIVNPNVYNLYTNKTYSQANLKTGIEFTNISQENYQDLNSEMNFSLNYTISEPPQYQHVIFDGSSSANTVITLAGPVFFYGSNDFEYYNALEGTIFESYNGMRMKNIEAVGTANNPVIFRGVGYENQGERHRITTGGITVFTPRVFGSVDEVKFSNVKFMDVDETKVELSIAENVAVPILLENIEVSNTSIHQVDDISIINSEVSKIDLSNLNLKISGSGPTFSTKVTGDINLADSRLIFYGYINFNILSDVILGNTLLTNRSYPSINYSPVVLKEIPGDMIWPGLTVYGGGVDFDGVTISNANYGINAVRPTQIFDVKNSEFNNCGATDIYISQANLRRGFVNISGNDLNPATGTQNSSITCIDPFSRVVIDNNTLTNVGLAGISLLNAVNIELNNNTIIGGNVEGFSTGIYSYFSSGKYNSNTITNCNDYGILLDNSQPTLLCNNIYYNAIGLYLTNNSNPILGPAQLPDKTILLGGSNQIYENANIEIYCNNSDLSSNTPYLQDGGNSIYDVSLVPDTLIYNKEPILVEPPLILAENNYWGGSSPSGRLIPNNSFDYIPYLTQPVIVECNPTSKSEDNSSESSEVLLLGAAMEQQSLGNHSASTNYYNQLLETPNSTVNPIIALNGIYSNAYNSNRNMLELESFYNTAASQNRSDTVFYKKALNLAIETKVVRNALDSALTEYDNIINASNSGEEVFYATVNKNRIIRIVLDSLLLHYRNGGGDNMTPGGNIQQLKKEALNLSGENSNSRTLREDGKAKGYKNPGTVPENDKLKALRNRVNGKIKSLDNLSDGEVTNLIVEKTMLDLLDRNTLYGLKPKTYGRGDAMTTNTTPDSYELFQNYPNPFNPSTTIRYAIANESLVKLKIYDITGKEVMTLVNELKLPGNYEVNFNGKSLSSGIYFYKIEAGSFKKTRRMVLVK